MNEPKPYWFFIHSKRPCLRSSKSPTWICKHQKNTTVKWITVVFSLHPDWMCKPKVYPFVASPLAEAQAQLASTRLDSAPTTNHHCTGPRYLLKTMPKINVLGVLLWDWLASKLRGTHTIRDSRKKTNWFCDRYDETAIWTVVKAKGPHRILELQHHCTGVSTAWSISSFTSCDHTCMHERLLPSHTFTIPR